MALSPDGKALVVSDADEGDNAVQLWDLASRRSVRLLTGHKRAVWCVAFAPSGRVFATGSGDNTIKLWDIAKKEQLREFQHDTVVISVAFSPDGKLMAASNGDSVLVWDLATGQKAAQLSQACRVRFSPNGNLLATSSGDTVRLWDVATWQNMATMKGQKTDVLGMAFSPDGRNLATRDGGGTLWLWDLAQKPVVIASSRGHTPTTPPSFAGIVTFSPDGRRLATSGADCNVKLWDVGLLQEVATLTGHDGPVYGLAFTPDGTMLATASGDTTVRLWQAPPLKDVLREPAEALDLPPVETIRSFALQLIGTAQATLTPEGDVNRIDVTAVDGTNWHVQLLKPFDDFQEGATYTVRFRAKAEATSRLVLWAQIGEHDWHGIGLNKEVPLSDVWRDYKYEFQAKDIAASNTVVFNLGDRTGTVWIADFSVTSAAK
jgi:WD40 repeat protein